MKKENLILIGSFFLAILLMSVVFAPKTPRRVLPPIQPTVVVPVPVPQPITINSYTKAVEVARATNKNMLLVFGADWCGPCKNLEEVLALPTVRKGMQPYIFYHVNVDKEPNVAKTFNVTGIPNYFIVTPNGQIIKTGQNYKNELGFLLWLKMP